MNAYEMADELHKHLYNDNGKEFTLEKAIASAATMLRQQADLLQKTEKRNVELQQKITKLLAKIEELYEEPGSYWFKEPDGV
jgi:chromosome segregation ATPase